MVNDAEETPVANVLKQMKRETAVPIHHITLAPNAISGASRSRNKGLCVTHTDFVAFLDDDDTWDPRFLEKTLPIARDTCDLALSWIDVQTHDGIILHERKADVPLNPRDIVACNPGFTGSNIIAKRTSMLALEGFDEQLHAYNDIDYLVRALEAGQRVNVTREVLSHQNITRGEHLSSRSTRRAEAIRRYETKHEHLLNRKNRRRLHRDYHLALRGKDSSLIARTFHLVAMWAYSTPGDLIMTCYQRTAGAKRAYE